MINKIVYLKIESKRQFELIDITDQVKNIVKEEGLVSGIITIFSPHTTASIRLNHNEPLLIQDLMKSVYKIAPLENSYSHDLFEIREHPAIGERSNGHAHVKAFMLGSSETVIVENNDLLVGEKQSIFFVEFDGGRKRQVHLRMLGE